LGIHIITNEKVAIKILEKDKITDKDDLDRIIREMKYLKTLNHPNIIKVFEVYLNIYLIRSLKITDIIL
jgi:serine/threonine protein kinase